ncbi:PREDICTED: uncharacterized protein LOC105126078 isoform X3 [Populus euphratica]|uniref:Uncharacterized protein LOC105126078 isoform X3 n=1 Tax=Populus euphratica TaxID=75702 RepID=A0AAJ6U8X8_POPEU|nr:PREDICTED: uncharacterized protein LOC105126078 isoform X3 [Populus euphratica]
MSEASSTRETSMETEEEDREEQYTDPGGQRLVLPEDGHGWKKYGQKFIKKRGKFRSRIVWQRRELSGPALMIFEYGTRDLTIMPHLHKGLLPPLQISTTCTLKFLDQINRLHARMIKMLN